MTGTALLQDLSSRDFTLAIEGDGIRIQPWSRLTSADKEALRQNKTEVRSLLLVKKALAAREAVDWSDDSALRYQQWACANRVDTAFEAGDLVTLQAAVEEFVRLMRPTPPTWNLIARAE